MFSLPNIRYSWSSLGFWSNVFPANSLSSYYPSLPISPLNFLSGFCFVVFHQNYDECIGNPEIQGSMGRNWGSGFGEVITLEDVFLYLFYVFEGLSLDVELAYSISFQGAYIRLNKKQILAQGNHKFSNDHGKGKCAWLWAKYVYVFVFACISLYVNTMVSQHHHY